MFGLHKKYCWRVKKFISLKGSVKVVIFNHLWLSEESILTTWMKTDYVCEFVYTCIYIMLSCNSRIVLAEEHIWMVWLWHIVVWDHGSTCNFQRQALSGFGEYLQRSSLKWIGTAVYAGRKTKNQMLWCIRMDKTNWKNKIYYNGLCIKGKGTLHSHRRHTVNPNSDHRKDMTQ